MRSTPADAWPRAARCRAASPGRARSGSARQGGRLVADARGGGRRRSAPGRRAVTPWASSSSWTRTRLPLQAAYSSRISSRARGSARCGRLRAAAPPRCRSRAPPAPRRGRSSSARAIGRLPVPLLTQLRIAVRVLWSSIAELLAHRREEPAQHRPVACARHRRTSSRSLAAAPADPSRSRLVRTPRQLLPRAPRSREQRSRGAGPPAGALLLRAPPAARRKSRGRSQEPAALVAAPSRQAT